MESPMSLDSMLALVGFAFVMSVTPGPSNVLLLASGVNFGFLRSIPLVLGISMGFLTMVLLVGLGLGELLQRLPVAGTVLKVACGAYVLWLAWKIARSAAVTLDRAAAAAPISFLQAALFQLVNPKAWAVALVVTVTYTDPDRYLLSLVALILVFAAVNLPSISVWALFGVALRRAMGDPRLVRIFNLAMALLLAGSMMILLWGSLTA
jgi:threonine/homoserine/homoserine lactone efflux protein